MSDKEEQKHRALIFRVGEKIENKLSYISDKYNQCYLKIVSSTRTFFSTNYYLNYPFVFVNNCKNKNTIQLGTLNITYINRKTFVFLLSITSLIFASYKLNTSIKLRWFIPYYLFYSLLLCRENLNPYLN